MKDIRTLLYHMLDAAASIHAYKLADFDAFEMDEKTKDAVMFNLIILGEAANSLPQDFREAHLEIPWASIIGTRNVIVHGYDQVRLSIVWDIIINDLEPLENNITL